MLCCVNDIWQWMNSPWSRSQIWKNLTDYATNYSKFKGKPPESCACKTSIINAVVWVWNISLGLIYLHTLFSAGSTVWKSGGHLRRQSLNARSGQVELALGLYSPAILPVLCFTSVDAMRYFQIKIKPASWFCLYSLSLSVCVFSAMMDCTALRLWTD